MIGSLLCCCSCGCDARYYRTMVSGNFGILGHYSKTYFDVQCKGYKNFVENGYIKNTTFDLVSPYRIDCSPSEFDALVELHKNMMINTIKNYVDSYTYDYFGEYVHFDVSRDMVIYNSFDTIYEDFNSPSSVSYYRKYKMDLRSV